MHSSHTTSVRTITVRQVPDDVYEALQALAQRHRRSLQQEAIALLERARWLRGESPLQRARNIRASLAAKPGAKRDFGDTLAEIREDRER